MSNWYSIIFCLLILAVIVIFHEFGHFIVAKANGIGVNEFMVGMGPVLLEKRWHGTRYTLRLIPFGGACIMKGDDNGIPDPEADEAEIKSGDSFASKSVWVRIATIFAGPFFNFILAFIISVIVIGFVGIDKPVIKAVLDNLPAKSAGLEVGDQIIKINGTSVRTSRDLSLYFEDADLTATQTLVVLRDGQKVEITLTPEYSKEYGKYMMGFSWNFARDKVGSLENLGYSLNEVWYWIKITVKSLGMLFTGEATVDDFSGPVGVAEVVDDVVEETKSDGWGYVVLNMLNLCILLSADIGVMNLLPIPAMDGGRLLFLFIEAIFRRPVPKKFEGYVHLAGIIFLLLFMVFIMFNDIRKLFI